MDFSLNAEQQLLKDSVDKYMAEQYSSEQRRAYMSEAKGFSQKVWAEFAELGWLTIPFAEDLGGFGGSVVDTSIVMEALGRAVAIEPYMATVLLGGQAIARGSNEQLKASYLEKILAGECQAALAYLERRSRHQLDAIDCSAIKGAIKSDYAYTISGTKTLVLNGAAADVIIVSAKLGEQLGLFAVPADSEGLSIEPMKLMDGQPIANVILKEVVVSEDQLLCAPENSMALLQSIISDVTIAVSAQAVGAMEYLLKASVEYCNTRKQFGQPIGKFQALQHRMVDMYTAIEQCRSLLVRALCSSSGNEPQAELDIAALKAMVGKHGRAVAEEAVQLHGGMGVTEELDIGDYLKRLMVIDHLFGDADWHRARFAELRQAAIAA